MNDYIFTNYDNYFCGTTHQMAEVNPLIQNIEYDEMPPTINYVNSVSCDMAPITQQTVSSAGEQRLHQQTNLFNFIPNQHEEEHAKHEGECPTKRVVSAVGLNSLGNSTTGVFGNIPFVQIHTTDVQPQRTSYGNVFRRNINKQDEIKSEPIKSENAEASKERINSTPTPPRVINQTQSETNTGLTKGAVTNEKSSNNINKEEKSFSILQICKCLKCPFISLREEERDHHVANQHAGGNVGDKRPQINCPGCSNIFYHQESLKMHMKLDHYMQEDDILKLLKTLISSTTKPNENLSRTTMEEAKKIINEVSHKEPLRKSRIYLKNVDCLREPNRQPMEQTDNQLREITTNSTAEIAKSNPPKQKISIKSVDVLREPALLRKDYEMQNSNINNFLNFNTDILNNGMDIISSPMNLNTTTTTHSYNQNLNITISKTNHNSNDSNSISSNPSSNVTNVESEKPRRPKIYVKSVESFNLMPMESLHSSNSNNTGYINNHNNTCNNNQVYDSNIGHLPFMFETNSSANNLNNNPNYINNHSEMDTFQFINTSNTNTNNYTILENSLFLDNNEEIHVTSEQMENITLISNAAIPTSPTAADISAMMNKPLTTAIQEQRGTLHLRTVDELNLMNKTEVQHLIAPNLDNNHANEVLDKVNSTSLNDINLIGDDLYEDDNFKFHDLDTQMVNDWPETYEDLAEDINCIIADASNENSAENVTFAGDNNNQKLSTHNFDIDTPQVSLITIRDIEELTGTTTNHVLVHSTVEEQPDLIVEQIQNLQHDPTMENISQEPLMVLPSNSVTNGDSNLKRESINATPETKETSSKVPETNTTKEIIIQSNEIPPLVPVTNTSSNLVETSLPSRTVNNIQNSGIPLPPLVPVSNVIKLNTSKPNKPSSPIEKGRIYVANNLMELPKRPVAVSATSGTSVRGRPFGSNRTRITKLKQTIGNSAEDLFSKCSVKGCAFRFKKAETVEYHRQCHDTNSDNPQAVLCPECNSKDFNNWNTLHTHLWRVHKIDMELYTCELCEFKTPIFSRLANTHAKIHFDDRNYKCEICGKAFKNSKQLKNHRRWHRAQDDASSSATITKPTPIKIHRCSECGSTFSQQKTLREHCCKKGDSSLKCSVCEKLMSSKSSLKLHLLTHSDGEKRYKCQNCDYATNDHNAFRRHRMGHENRKMYECNFCSYKSVQSVAYQKHIIQKHPDKADSVIYKCTVCPYSTINHSLLIVHQAKHDKLSNESAKANTSEDTFAGKIIEKSITENATELQMSKIKVKSNLFTTNNINSVSEVNISHCDLNLVQLYNNDRDSAT